jgi:hypothetical protein
MAALAFFHHPSKAVASELEIATARGTARFAAVLYQLESSGGAVH